MPAGAKRAKKTQYNVHEAKTQLSKLLNRVEKGETLTLAKANRPIAMLVPLPQPRKWGTAKGQIWIAPDFDAPMPEFEDLFYDGPIEP
ncbi:MAG: type II toxin-antitoxin system Phd/YefM family antitoxin [Terriglobales bacterium]